MNYKTKSADKASKPRLPIDGDKIKEASAILRAYRSARCEFDSRIAEEEEFWKLRHRSFIDKDGKSHGPTSAWLFNSICNKHSDMMDNLPGFACFAREPSDEPEAQLLSKIIPVITERNSFRKTYSDNTWCKLKHGTSVYGVFWNNRLGEGLGDVDIRRINLENIYWEPGITDIQDSRNLFIISKCDPEILTATYGANIKRFETVRGQDGSQLAVCVDWYYKKRTQYGDILHICKYCGDEILFASENLPEYRDGWYAHGQYPVVLDVLYPEEGTCCGFGLISVAKDPQLYIDRLDGNIMEYLDWASHVRFWAKKSLGVNEEDFCDLSRRIVEVEGDIDDEKLKQITVNGLDDLVVQVKRLKIDELKETSGNRDVSQGSTKGITAASAILALQEAGNKGSRDIIQTSFDAYERIIGMVIELIRQFYTEPRCFRISGENGMTEYLPYSNSNISSDRLPIFDIVVSAESTGPTAQLQKNEFAKSLYDSGAFSPEKLQETLIMLEMMNFDGIEKLRAVLRGERKII